MKQKLTEGDLPGEEADQSSEPEPSEEHEDDSRQDSRESEAGHDSRDDHFGLKRSERG